MNYFILLNLVCNFNSILTQTQFSKTVEFSFNSLPEDTVDVNINNDEDVRLRKEAGIYYHNLILDANVTSHEPSNKVTNQYMKNVKQYNKLIQNSDPPKPKQCTKTFIRKEFHDLTEDELKTYINAINQLYKTPSVRRPGFSVYSEFTMIHVESADEGHSSAQFFPWHRAFTFEFEKALQQINETITLPYWDWGMDAYYPELSDVLNYYGGSIPNLDKSAGCIQGGPFAHWRLNYPYKHCITRGANLNITNPTRWMDNDELSLMIKSTELYPRFEFEFEVDSHSLVHFWLAGSDDDDQFNIGDMFYMHSPNDPIFWLHHSNVDRIFHQWQVIHDTNRTKYSGASRTNKFLRPSDIMMPWDYDVKSVLDIKNLCYDYQPPIRIKEESFIRERNIKIEELKKLKAQILNTNSLNKNEKEDIITVNEEDRTDRKTDLLIQSQKYDRATKRERNKEKLEILSKEESKLISEVVKIENDEIKLDCNKLQDKLKDKAYVYELNQLPINNNQLIVPSDYYFDQMNLKLDEFYAARNQTYVFLKLIMILKNHDIVIPDIMESLISINGEKPDSEAIETKEDAITKAKNSNQRVQDYIPKEVLNLSPEKAIKIIKNSLNMLPTEFKQPLEQTLKKIDYPTLKREVHLFIKNYKRYIQIYQSKLTDKEEPVDYFKAFKRTLVESLAKYRTKQLFSNMMLKLTND
ncbi:Di-copper centre-containing protein [Neoconidiobolus thromboides FSU 785]|nr:Di-copper centre-containing protein [Neoconidiobolus thromboides FSU 785]